MGWNKKDCMYIVQQQIAAYYIFKRYSLNQRKDSRNYVVLLAAAAAELDDRSVFLWPLSGHSKREMQW